MTKQQRQGKRGHADLVLCVLTSYDLARPLTRISPRSLAERGTWADRRQLQHRAERLRSAGPAERVGSATSINTPPGGRGGRDATLQLSTAKRAGARRKAEYRSQADKAAKRVKEASSLRLQQQLSCCSKHAHHPTRLLHTMYRHQLSSHWLHPLDHCICSICCICSLYLMRWTQKSHFTRTATNKSWLQKCASRKKVNAKLLINKCT